MTAGRQERVGRAHFAILAAGACPATIRRRIELEPSPAGFATRTRWTGTANRFAGIDVNQSLIACHD